MKSGDDILAQKKALLGMCVAKLREKVAMLKTAMDEAQKDANEHKGAMESRYDTFKEEAQALRDGFARQIQETGEALAMLEQAEPHPSSIIQLGAIVVTSKGRYFISTGLLDSDIALDGHEYQLVSFASPLMKAMRQVRVGTDVTFGKEKFRLVEIL